MKGQIRKQNSASVSVMPEGLVNALTIEDLASLIAYMETLRTKN